MSAFASTPTAQAPGSMRDQGSQTTYESAKPTPGATTTRWDRLVIESATGVSSVQARANDPHRAEIRAQVRDVLEPYQASIMKRRNDLIEKEFNGTLTPVEERQLGYARWQLDQLEDATRGPALDALRAHAVRHRELAEAVSAVVKSIQAERPTATLPRRRRR